MRLTCLLAMFVCLFSCNQQGEKEKIVEVPVDRPIFVPVPPDGPPPPIVESPRPGFITLDRLEDAMSLDLRSLSSDQDRLNTRYLVGCNYSNRNEDTKFFEQAVNLAMNRLSNEIALERLTTIGPGDCIYRMNLEDFTMDAAEWQILEDRALLDFETQSIRGQELQFLTKTRKPYLFAQDAMCVAFNCDAVSEGNSTYYELTDQANWTFRFLEDQGIDVQKEVDDEAALFAGFSNSQIALQKTRMVAILEQGNGVGSICAGTFDTVLGGDDLFANPFIFEVANAIGNVRSDKVFLHNAQEWICQLPNGLTLWRLNNNIPLTNGPGGFAVNGGGASETVAPTNIVVNVANPGLDPSIRLGDCNRCHYNVIIPFNDQIGRFIESNSNFNAFEKDLGRVFYGRQDRLQGLADSMNRKNTQALQQLGVNAPEDPISVELFDDLRSEMNIDQVAAFTFLTTEEFRVRLTGSTVSSQVFGNLLGGGRVSLATLSANFATLVDELGLYDDEVL